MQLDSLIWKPYASQAADGGMLGEMDGFDGMKTFKTVDK